MSGWFAIKHGIVDHPIFAGKPDRIAAWVWILDKTAWRDTRQDAGGKTVTVRRGQVLTSYRQMSKATGVSIKALRGLVERLRNEDTIDTDMGTGRLLITIRNYEKYQSATKEGAQTRAQEGHRKGTQKEQENKRTSNNTSSNDDGFDEFWQHVPRKVAKGDARKAFKAALKKAPLDQIMNGMECYAASVKGKDPQYIAHPATWLNGERWADEAKTDTRKWYEKSEEERTKADRDAERFRWL